MLNNAGVALNAPLVEMSDEIFDKTMATNLRSAFIGTQLAARQKKFIEQLEAALTRIQNKTYGICRGTGKLIPAERLRAVPHTTMSMEAKLKQA